MNSKRETLANLQKQINQLYDIIFSLSEYVGWQEIEKLGLNFQRNYNIVGGLINSPEFIFNEEKQQKIDDIQSTKNLSTDLIEDYRQEISTMMENGHKDILQDPSENKNIYNSSSFCYQEDDTVSCEDKVQRLTAQLTAAYHRIASLEEQLISHRQKTETRQQGFHHNH